MQKITITLEVTPEQLVKIGEVLQCDFISYIPIIEKTYHFLYWIHAFSWSISKEIANNHRY